METSNKGATAQAEQHVEIISLATTPAESATGTAGDKTNDEDDATTEDANKEVNEDSNDEADVKNNFFIPYLLDKFRGKVESVIKSYSSKAPDDPKLKRLARRFMKLVEGRSSIEIITLLQTAESILSTTRGENETQEQIAEALMQLWQSENTIRQIKKDWFDAKRIDKYELQNISRLATKHKQRLEVIEATAICNEKWGEKWEDELQLDTLPEQTGGYNRLICGCRNLAIASSDWNQAKTLLNYSVFSRIILWAHGKRQGHSNLLRVCREDIERAAFIVTTHQLIVMEKPTNSTLSLLWLRYNEHGVLIWDHDSERLPRDCHIHNMLKKDRKRLKECYDGMEREGWFKHPGKRRASSALDGPAVQRPRNA